MVAYRLSETIVIYPITPSSPMAELSDEWSNQDRPNLWQGVPAVSQMQSEGGAAGAVHGTLQAGSMATTFTASQGLLLMIPNMYKIAGELTPFCMHVTARSLATHALSIFGDHSDVMACRQTGFALLASSSVQEAHDMAAIAHASTLRRVPFLHFFDGFRTSHEINTYDALTDDSCGSLIDEEFVEAHHQRGLTPTRRCCGARRRIPTSFSRPARRPIPTTTTCPAIVETHGPLREITGRDYGSSATPARRMPKRVLVVMGSGAETAQETSEWLNRNGRENGRAQGPPLPSLFGAPLRAGAPATVQDRRAGPDQGTRRDRRTALPGRRHGAGRGLRRR